MTAPSTPEAQGELRERLRDIATRGGTAGRIPAFLEEELDKLEQLVRAEVRAVLERLEDGCYNTYEDTGDVIRAIEQEKKRYE